MTPTEQLLREIKTRRMRNLKKAWEWAERNKKTSLQRFEEKIKKTEACWEWQGATVAKNGEKTYGQMYFEGKQILAHRFSWLNFKGEIPPKMFVCHRCNNKRCVRPSHLYLANNRQNILDAMKDGLIKTPPPKKRCTNGHYLSGENLYLWVDKNKKTIRACKECRRQNVRRNRR